MTKNKHINLISIKATGPCYKDIAYFLPLIGTLAQIDLGLAFVDEPMRPEIVDLSLNGVTLAVGGGSENVQHLVESINAAFLLIDTSLREGNSANFSKEQFRILRILSGIFSPNHDLFPAFQVESPIASCQSKINRTDPPANPLPPKIIRTQISKLSRRRIQGAETITLEIQDSQKCELRLHYDSNLWDRLREAESAKFFICLRVWSNPHLFKEQMAPSLAELVNIEEHSLLNFSLPLAETANTTSSLIAPRQRRGQPTSRRAHKMQSNSEKPTYTRTSDDQSKHFN